MRKAKNGMKVARVYLDEPRLRVLGLLVHVEVAHVHLETELFDAHPHGAARRRGGHVDELEAEHGESRALLSRLHRRVELVRRYLQIETHSVSITT